MNVAYCLLVAAAAFSAWYHNEYIVVAHLHLLIGSSSTIIIDAYLHSLASPLSFQHRILYTIPVALALSLVLWPLCNRLDEYKICFLLTVAVVYIVRWDSYLIRTGIWSKIASSFP